MNKLFIIIIYIIFFSNVSYAYEMKSWRINESFADEMFNLDKSWSVSFNENYVKQYFPSGNSATSSFIYYDNSDPSDTWPILNFKIYNNDEELNSFYAKIRMDFNIVIDYGAEFINCKDKIKEIFDREIPHKSSFYFDYEFDLISSPDHEYGNWFENEYFKINLSSNGGQFQVIFKDVDFEFFDQIMNSPLVPLDPTQEASERLGYALYYFSRFDILTVDTVDRPDDMSDISSVPLPSSALLLGLGSLGLCWSRRRVA